MVSKPIRVAVALLILLLPAGFLYYYFGRSLGVEEIISRTLKQGKKIESYHLLLEMESDQDGELQEYFAQVWFGNPHYFRMEFYPGYPADDAVPDQAIFSDGEGTWLFSPEIGDKYALDSGIQEQAPTPFLLHTFLGGLAGSQESSLLGVERIGKRAYYLLRTVPQVTREDHAYEEIWLEKRTLLPVRILVYDQQAKLKQRITYHKIIPNIDIPRELFQR